MKIKKLVINGFKSFGENTEIILDENLIGIVGPNGSGKSNIIDAIRWVLGQQRMSELRTKSNTDVIFSGSDEKAAKNVAEVTIVFDNEDRYLDIEYGEVSIKRRLFRTGENEYYLNNNRCRLIDINNLILDKGFGKDSFSIISQGKVEEIIMSKPEERRQIIDEVAGISKYKMKKKITLNKLDKVNQNLEKIDFILDEIENRIEPLEKEKEKALKYEELKSKLETGEKSLIANKIYNNKQELEALNEDLLKVSLKNNEETKKINDIENEIQKIDSVVSENQLSISSLNEKISGFKNEQINLENEVKLLSKKKELYDDSNQEDAIRSIRDQLDSYKKEESSINNKKHELEPKINSTKRVMQDLKEEIYILQNKIYKAREDKEDLKQASDLVKTPYHIRKVLDNKYPGVIGTVKDQISIFSKYEIAINTILGYRQNEIIVENDKIVREIINYLKENRLGKITFAPLNTVKPRFFDQNSLAIIDNSDLKIKKAINCVEFDDKNLKVIESLLGNTLIADSLEEAQKINRQLNSRYQIVTLDGEILATSGKVTGGYDKANKNLLNRKKEADIDVEIKELNILKEKKSQELDKISFENSDNEIQIELINSKLASLRSESESLRLEYESLVGEAENVEENSIFKVEADIKVLEDKILEANKEKFLKEEEIKVAFVDKEKLQQELVDIRANSRMSIQNETEIKMKIDHYEFETKELIEDLGEKYNISFTKAYEEAMVIEDIDKYDKEIKSLKSSIRDLGFVNVNAIKEYDEQKERYDFYLGNKEDLVGSKNKIIDIVDKIDNFVTEVFSDAFTKLNEEFKIVFEQLFEGGSATLNLTDQNDLLSTGVEIIARPPGKKAQTIGLLSGGEKALTAIALLFSILKVRIVPFTILDEVEAALDESNVVKYIEYLKVFSKKTQFILITHRQTTMEKIDKLYGVTMVEKGISSVLNIELKEGEADV